MVRDAFAMVQKVGGEIMHSTNKKAPEACDFKGLETDNTNDLNYATGNRHSKALATLIAKLALAGHAVHQLESGGFIVGKYGMTRYCGDFAELQRFARQLGVSK